MRLGMGSFAYRWSVGRPYYRPENPMTVDQLLDRCIAHGVKAVLLCNNYDLYKFDDAELARIGERIRKEGMVVETGSRGTDKDYFRRMMEVSRILGSKVLRCGWDMDRDADEAGIRQQIQNGIETFKGLMPLAHEYGLTVAIENGKLNRVEEVKEIVEGVNDPSFGCVLDTCNSTCFITPTNTVVDILAPYTKSVHIKDYIVKLDPRGDIIYGVPMGKGFVDFKYVIKKLEENGYDGNLFIELYIDRFDDHSETLAYEEKCVAESVAYAKEVLKLS